MTKKLIWIGVIFLAFIAVFFFGWWMKPAKIVSDQNEVNLIRDKHAKDSIRTVAQIKAKDSVYDALRVVVVSKNRQIVALRQDLEKERKKIQELWADETIALFSQNTGENSVLAVLNKDTMCISPIPAIKMANIYIAERNEMICEVAHWEAKSEVLQDLVDNRNEKIVILNTQVANLTQDYYKSLAVINKQEELTKKLNKKVRSRNIAIGIISGIAAGGIVTALIVN